MISMDPDEHGKYPCLSSLTFPAKNHAPTELGKRFNPTNGKGNHTEHSGSTEPTVETKNL